MLKEYEILGVDQYATREEITKAYRRAAMRWHPDRNPDNPEATERFQEIARAYQLLIKLTPRARPAAGTAPPPRDFAAAMAADAARRRAQEMAQAQAREQADAERRRQASERWVEIMRAERERAEAQEAEKRREEMTAAAPAQSSAWFSLCLAGAGLGCFFALAYPLGILMLSVFLLLALAWLPNGRTYTDLALAAAIRCYFLALTLWLVWRMVERW